MALKTIGDVVDEYIISAGYDSRNSYARLLNMAIRGLKDMNYDVSGEPTWALLELDDMGRATIPDGMVNIIGIFINSPQGLLEVVEGTKLAPTIVTAQGTEEILPNQINYDNANLLDGNFINPARHFQNGQFIGAFYAGVESNPFKYRRNYDTNKFEFSSNVCNPIIEYLKDPSMVNGKHVVNPLIMDALMYWLHFADTRFKRSVSPNEKDFNQRKYIVSKNLAARRMVSMSPANFRDAARSGYSLTTK